jgi:hypothetical protein
MSPWERHVIEAKKNLWLVTTKCQKFVCTKIDGEFFIKSPIKLIIRSHHVLSSEKL